MSVPKPLALVLVMAATLASLDARLGSQAMTVSTKGGAVRVQAPGFRFMVGLPTARLKNGLTVRVELEMRVLPASGSDTPASQVRQTFVLSYDLWEERFAAAVSGTGSRSISHLTAAAAEAWCIEQLTVPVSGLGALRTQPFWIRLESRILDEESDAGGSGGLTLRGIIDTLSRKAGEKTSRSMEGGPFTVQQ